MKRTARNLITALCCTGLLAATGCSSAGELSVTGMYGSQGQALSGDRCDEFLMHAAEADTADAEEAAKEEYRECVEDALHEDGRNGECRDDDDPTCDIILDEIGDTVERLRNEAQMSEAPDCANPEAGGQEALCHLMAAYEACELDRDGDGDPDVHDRPDEDQDRPDGDENTEPGDGEDPDQHEGDNQNPDEPNQDGDRTVDTATCDEIRQAAENVGEGDREFLKNERPECFEHDPATDPNDPDQPEGDTNTEPSGNDADAFCQALEEEIANADTEERRAELEEIKNRECPL